MHTLIDGKEIARLVRADVKARVKEYTEKHGKAPALCVILAGDNPASKVYVASKEKACGWVGIRSVAKKFSADITEKELIEERGRLELPGRPLLYGTTKNFLRCFSLKSLDELPPLPESDKNKDDVAEQLEVRPDI